MKSIDVELRVRYAECDAQNMAHHSVYPVWLEVARTELLRTQDAVYRELEAMGIFFVVARLSVRYRRPARYDDLLRVHVKLAGGGSAKVVHLYEIHRGQELLATAETTLVCVGQDGRFRKVPPELL